jgi:hypothetical protein
MLKAPGYEQSVVAENIERYLKDFLKNEYAPAKPPKPLFDWEGKDRKRKRSERYYPVLGTSAYPDAAVLIPFKCAFEFDRGKKLESARFRTAFMKASVHVLSGYYKACLLVYILRQKPNHHEYLKDDGRNTKKLIHRLPGLYVTLI